MNKESYRVLVDTDPSLGRRGAEVDDGLALFLIFNNPQLFIIEGITTVFGNIHVKKAFEFIKKYLELVNRIEVPHFLGASSKYTINKLTDASKFLIEKVKENPNELTLMTLGPLTNIATALEHYPEFFDDLKQIIFMGGTVEPTSAFSDPFIFGDSIFDKVESNFNNDPFAAKKLIETETQTPRIGMGLDVCCRAVFKEEHLKVIESTGTILTEYMLDHIKAWLKIWKFNKSDGFFPFDTFVPIYLIKSDLFTTTDFFLSVDTELFPGRLLILDSFRKNSAPITYCMNFRENFGEKYFMDLLLSNLIK